MNIGIIGPGNMGKFHAREFASLGENVSALLGRNKSKTEESVEYLRKNYKINAKAYISFSDFTDGGKLSAVSICTPLETHYKFIKDSLNKGLHVMCEKPFVKSLKEAEEVLAIARKKNLVVTLNTQWPSILENLKIPLEIKSFEMIMQPGTLGVEMLNDHLPHMISMLLKICGIGKIERLSYLQKTEKKIVISFNYIIPGQKIKVLLNLNHKIDRPRKVEFKVNHIHFERILGKNYSQSIRVNGQKIIPIEDPLKGSIRRFVDAIKKEAEPLITSEEILEIIKIQEEILRGF